MDKLSTTIRDYAWGSTTSMAELFGREASGSPEAEMWIGAHPGAPSVVEPSGLPLDAAIEADPAGTLGAEVAQRYGRLPYLLKILAAAAPLSLQVHPTLEQAAAGFAFEEANGPAIDAPDRNYKDDQHKPEMIVALTAFEALSGFRRPAEAAGAFAWLAAAVDEPSAAAAAQNLTAALTAGDLAPAVALLLGDGEDVRRLATLAARAVDAAPDAAAAADASLGLLPRLAGFYPGDTGVLLALMLNLVSLRPGQAMSLPAGNIHAYLHGTGVEIMANSDNVLRGGLTPKHVDVPELLKVVRFEATEPHAVEPEQLAEGLAVYRSGFAEFDLGLLTHAAAPVTLPAGGPCAVVVVSGSLTLRAGGAELTLGPGESAFVEASDAPATAEGDATLEAYVAFTPLS
ncbi:mannose-6-phosphate isomerase, class I [Galactobacter valiniphilus]|uniref:mannose-6-phosphate isomerase, class I n=1 Tax=Galactobacter valiniphilus TaxID=2676122 RepID=UPI00373526FC